MIIDTKFCDRYHVINGNDIHHGWNVGWTLFNQKGTPKISMDFVETYILKPNLNYSNNLNFELWKDNIDYDQNSPGILKRIDDLDKRVYSSDIEKAFWVNVTRVPICVSYLAALAKVRPMTILELGTGGDSAHSTGMFIYWLDSMFPRIFKVRKDSINIDDLKLEPGGFIESIDPPAIITLPVKLISVDRHPLSHVWLRYREYPFWHFIQGDSITVMKKLFKLEMDSLPSWYDMIFIDSSHTFPHTLCEITQASCMTHAILLDDTTMAEVKQSLDEFLKEHSEWLRIDLAHGVTLIERHEYL